MGLLRKALRLVPQRRPRAFLCLALVLAFAFYGSAHATALCADVPAAQSYEAEFHAVSADGHFGSGEPGSACMPQSCCFSCSGCSFAAVAPEAASTLASAQELVSEEPTTFVSDGGPAPLFHPPKFPVQA
jgi:hypothetical protein